MSTALNSGLVSGSVDASLDEIEAKSTGEFPPNGDITIGPFAVLNLASASHKPRGSFASDAADRATDESHNRVFDDSLHSVHTSLASEEFLGLTDDLLQWSDIFGFNDNLFGITSNVSVISRDYPGLSSIPRWLASESEMYNASLAMDLDPTHDILGLHVERQGHSSNIQHPQTTIATPTGAVDILDHASFLIKVFQKHVVPQLTVVPLGKKAPWNILNVPTAIVTLADITVMESQDVTHARYANLFSLLSCSAMYLSVTPSSGYGGSILTTDWQQVACKAYYEAKAHMRISLSEETDGPTKSKYKDQLMAICAMIESAVRYCHAPISSDHVEPSTKELKIFLGQHQDVRCYMIDAERLLRLRGLVKSKTSHKARLLINVYSWLRIVGESTYILHDFSPSNLFLDTLSHQIRSCGPPRRIGDVSSTMGRHVRLDDFLDLEHSDDDLNIDEPKDQNRDIPDIHLHDSRKSAHTLSKQAYGLSETWLSLVSQTIRLANVLEKLEAAQSTDIQIDSKVWNFVQKRSNRLENVILSYSARKNDPDRSDWPAVPYFQVLRAFNAALVILFYRRVRKVHSGILQGHVDSVINALKSVHATPSDVEHAGPGALWPIFLAGCEATTKERRDAILKLLERSKIKCGLSPVDIAENIMTAVWKRQDEHLKGNPREPFPTWMDILKKRKTWPIFC